MSGATRTELISAGMAYVTFQKVSASVMEVPYGAGA
jgi:hypothetical protein